MKGWFVVLVFCWVGGLTYPQSNYQEAFTMGDDAFIKGEFQKAIAFYFAAEAFDPEKKQEVKEKVIVVFERIEKLKNEADQANQNAQIEKEKAYKQALTTYANDLAYKSKIALKEGDLNTAFRLAEFAYRYGDAENPQVIQALLEAYTYNVNPSDPPLSRVKNLNGHFKSVNSIVFSPDGKQLATGSSDNTTKIWDTKSGDILMTLKGHAEFVNSIAFSPDGKQLAIGSSDNTAKIWDAQNGNLLMTLSGHSEYVTSIAFSPDGNHLATCSSDNTIKIWDLDMNHILKK